MTPPLFAAALARLRDRFWSVSGALIIGYAPLFLALLALALAVGDPSAPASASTAAVALAAALVVFAWFGCSASTGVAVHALVRQAPAPLPVLLRESGPRLGATVLAASKRVGFTVLVGVATFGLAIPVARWFSAGWVPATVVADPGAARATWRRWPHLLAAAHGFAAVLWAALTLNVLLSWTMIVRQIARVDGPRLDLAANDLPVLLVSLAIGFVFAEAARLATVVSLVEQVRQERYALDVEDALARRPR